MGIADDMKRITENIVASYDGRVRALGDLVADTKKTLADARRTVTGFAQTRKEMSEEQARNLADFVKDLTKNVGNMLEGFRNDLKKVGADRIKMAEELKAKLAKEAKDLKNDVKKRLKEFDESHAAMSETLRKDLTKFVKDVASDVKNILDGARSLIGEYKADMTKTRDAWQKMEASLARPKKAGVMPQIEAGKKDTAALEAGKKPRKRGRRKSGRRKKR